MPTATPLDDLHLRARLDPQGMLNDLAAAPRGCATALAHALEHAPDVRARNVLIVGMGASGAAGDLLAATAHAEGAAPIHSLHTASLPHWATPHDVLCAVSYSGDTPEVLLAAAAARRARIPIVAITHGGRLATWARDHRVPILSIHPTTEPRAALGILLGAALGVAIRAGALPAVTPTELAGDLTTAVRAIAWDTPHDRNPAKQLATALHPAHPLIVGPGHLHPVAVRWSTQWAENAKAVAIPQSAPELFHNFIEAVGAPAADTTAVTTPLTPGLLTDRHIPTFEHESLRLLHDWAAAAGLHPHTVAAASAGRLAGMIELALLGDFASAYLGLLRGERLAHLHTIPALRTHLRRSSAARTRTA